jgi:hypothetical protein
MRDVAMLGARLLLGGGALAGTLIAKMVTGKPAGPVEATAGAAGAAGADEPQDD